MNEHEQKQERRRQRLLALAKSKAENADKVGAAREQIASVIPLGQPILVGHHSERRHRRDIKRINALMRKEIDELKEAVALERRAAAVGSGGVSSDDPDAIDKLKEKMVFARTRRDAMVRANAEIRRGLKAGRSPADIAAELDLMGLPAGNLLLTPEPGQRPGHQAWEISNLGAEVRRLQKRIEDVSAAAAIKHEEIPFDGGSIEIDPAANRVRVRHDAKPPEQTRKDLRRAGFVWSPTSGAWQRKLSNGAIFAAKRVAELELFRKNP